MKISKKTLMSVGCIVEMFIVIGSMSACGMNGNNATPQLQTIITNETQQSATPSNGTGQTAAPSNESQQDASQSDAPQQSTPQPEQNSNEQISLDDAKQAALIDAGVNAADVKYTKEKLDYEDGIAVYDIEFYAGSTEYEYEINATTGAVFSKSIETFQTQATDGNQTGASETYIDADSAKVIALDHAGFSEADVSRLKNEFDFDDGQAVYEIEFDKDGREYEYKINAVDGSIMEYEVD